jgi:hypothetical protein
VRQFTPRLGERSERNIYKYHIAYKLIEEADAAMQAAIGATQANASSP